MNKEEFKAKFGLKFRNESEEIIFFSVLDDLYLKFTRNQAADLVLTFYDNADDIFNEINAAIEKAFQKVNSLIEDFFDKPGEA